MTLNAYYPKPLFPPVSLSNGCMLMCKHCMGFYLRGMEHIYTPEDLISYCRTLKTRGGKGVLVSGGCDENGRIINLREMVQALEKIKNEMDLIIAIHPGYVDSNLAEKLAEVCDVAFVDVIGSRETAYKVIGTDKAMGIHTLKNLKAAGIPVTPHITIGLHYGKIIGEFNALKIIKKFCERVVFNIICKTKNTPFEEINIPSLQQIKNVMEKAGGLKVSLGCMRPRGMEIEELAIELGITDIALPSKKAIAYALKKGYKIKKIPACCGITEEIMKKIKMVH